MFLHRRLSVSHNRALSVMSTSTETEHDLCAMAELMSPVIADRPDNFSEASEELGVALDDQLEALIEPSINGLGNSAIEFPLYTPSSPSSNRNSVFYDSDFDQPSDCDHLCPPKPTAYPAFHLPRPRPRLASAIDSDTPSLSSSTSFSSLGSISRSQSRRSSPPVSPATLNTPIEYQSAGVPHLAIIEERYAEDQDIPYRLSMESVVRPNSLTSRLASVHMEDPLNHHDSPILKKRVPLLDHLKINSMSHSPALHSPAFSSNSSLTSPVTRHRVGSGVSFTHFLGGGAKGGKAEKGGDEHSFSSSSGTQKLTKQEEKQRKADEKKRRKAEARAKTQQLAMDLKEIASNRATALQHLSVSGKPAEGKPEWMNAPPSMFGDVNFVFGFS